MARVDPVEQALVRMELRRFSARCDTQGGLIQRADSLREVARLINVTIPFKIANEYEARDVHRRLVLAAEERARELIAEQIKTIVRVEGDAQVAVRNKVREDWSNLTGLLAHLRTWANSKLRTAEQNM